MLWEDYPGLTSRFSTIPNQTDRFSSYFIEAERNFSYTGTVFVGSVAEPESEHELLELNMTSF
jgi:hypothetical protein